MGIKKAIISIGNPLKSDDNIGNLILDEIENSCQGNYYFFKGGMNPENFIEPLKKIKPDVIFFIDVALFEGKIGDVKLFNLNEVEDMNISTHYFPISVLKKYFPETRLFLIGVKPKILNFGQNLSSELKLKLPVIIEKVRKIIENF